MAGKKQYYAVDKDGKEFMYDSLPVRYEAIWNNLYHNKQWFSELTEGTIEAITGIDLTWGDEPIECVISSIRVVEKPESN